MNNNKHKHLTFEERRHIEVRLNENASFKAIGKELGKDCTTISKEVRNHISFERKGGHSILFNDCLNRKSCHMSGGICSVCDQHKKDCCRCGRCIYNCPDYIKELCPRHLKPPYTCNGCEFRFKCSLEKHYYRARYAQKEYEEVRSESRCGFNVTENELKQIDSVISPLLKNGQSIHHILTNNQDIIPCCEKTAYVYADNGLFTAINLDMPRKVRFRPRKKKSVPLKVDKSCRIGRTYEDYILYKTANPSLPVTELDSVEGVKGGAVLLTIHFVLPKLQLAFLREANDSKSVTDIFNHLYDVLGFDRFTKLLPLCLADNGTEFSDPFGIEVDEDGVIRSQLFYCDPSSPGQKGACENNHEFIRRIIPKGIDLGQFSQEQINLMMDHINSYGRPELGDKSPYEMFEFYYGKEILSLLGVHRIPANEIILTPKLFQ